MSPLEHPECDRGRGVLGVHPARPTTQTSPHLPNRLLGSKSGGYVRARGQVPRPG